MERDDKICLLYREGKSSTEIAEIVGLSDTHVRRILRRKNVPIRSASEGKKLSHARPEVKAKLSISNSRPCPEKVKEALRARIGPKNHAWKGGVTMSGNGYLYYTASPYNGEKASEPVHRVKAGIPKGKVVHHKDENKLNNDISNLQIMDKAEHARMHALKSGLGRHKR